MATLFNRAAWVFAVGLAGSGSVQCGGTEATVGDGGVDAMADAPSDTTTDGGVDAADAADADIAEGCDCGPSEVCIKYVSHQGSPGVACLPLASSCDGGAPTCACMMDSGCPPGPAGPRECEATTNADVLLCITNLP